MSHTETGPSTNHRFVFPANATSVRNVLQNLQQELSRIHLTPDDQSSVLIVLAEALNNIVEHACAGAGGLIWLDISCDAGGARCTLQDDGIEMAGGALPAARMPKLNGQTDGLPEGGFGWALIQSLASQIRYARLSDRNQLSFDICFGR